MSFDYELTEILERGRKAGYNDWMDEVVSWHDTLHGGTIHDDLYSTDLRTLHNIMTGYGFVSEENRHDDDVVEIEDLLMYFIEDHFERSEDGEGVFF